LSGESEFLSRILTDAHHVRVWAPDAEWLDGSIRELLLYQVTFANGSHPGNVLAAG
jgi:hypothetical protein